VTGGARGIGRAIVELFVQEGAIVYIWDLLEEGTQLAEDIRAKGGEATFTKISVTDRPAIDASVKAIFDKHGRIDILINNAGITRDKTLAKMSEEDWQLVIDINLGGVFKCTQAVVPYMRQNNYGRIISAASTVGIRGNFGQTNYVATKAGVIGMTKTWALELGKYGITANSIAPGYTKTPMTDKIPSELTEGIIKSIPVRSLAEPIDIAYGYLYLAAESGRFVTGICLPIDGGVSR